MKKDFFIFSALFIIALATFFKIGWEAGYRQALEDGGQTMVDRFTELLKSKYGRKR